jgi:hypothetical protein
LKQQVKGIRRRLQFCFNLGSMERGMHYKINDRSRFEFANDEGQRAIHCAASNGHTESVLQLYDLGADPNVTKITPAHLASAEGNQPLTDLDILQAWGAHPRCCGACVCLPACLHL